MIDDGSTDGGGAVCDELSNRYSCIKTIHKQNEGAGSARNIGIKQAQGEYVYFFDIDDLADVNLLEYCVTIMDTYLTDIMIFGYHSIQVETNRRSSFQWQSQIIHSNVEFRNSFFDICIAKTNGFVWNKFYRRSFLNDNNLLFENQKIQQDEVFNLLCYRHLNSCFISDKILYNYYVYSEGNTRSSFIEDRFGIYKSVRQQFESLVSYWNLNDSRIITYLNSRFFDSVIQCLTVNMFEYSSPWDYNCKRKEMNRILNDDYTVLSLQYGMSSPRLEDKLYAYACKCRSLFIIHLLYVLFSAARTIKNKIMK